MSELGLVIPIYKDSDLLRESLPKIKEHYPDAKIIVVADDIESMDIARQEGVFVPFHEKKMGFGKSLKEGLCLAWFTFGCKKVVIADCDHPFDAIDRFIAKLDEYDVVVGLELGKDAWKISRILSNRLIRKTLLDDVNNPTCGFAVFTGEILSRIPWDEVQSPWDMIHPEILYHAKKVGGRITECSFAEVEKERHYSKRRYVSFFLSYFRILGHKLWNGG